MAFTRSRMMALAVALASSLAAGPALAACGNDASGFEDWLANFKQDAVSLGISQSTVNAALAALASQVDAAAPDAGAALAQWRSAAMTVPPTITAPT